MTIPLPANSSNWCSDCSEPCFDHATMCTICGATLGSPPPEQQQLLQRLDTQAPSASEPMDADDPDEQETLTEPALQARLAAAFDTAFRLGDREAIATLARLTPEDVVIARLQQASDEVTGMLQRLRAQVNEASAEQDSLRRRIEENRIAWQALPPELLDPNGMQQETSNQGTSSAVLKNLSRTLLTEYSAMFYRCSLSVQQPSSSPSETLLSSDSVTTTVMEAIPGEFGEYNRGFRFDNAMLVVANPLTGKHPSGSHGEKMEKDVLTSLKASVRAAVDKAKQEPSTQPPAVILYFVRGGGLSFVEKALLAQSAGAMACIIGNHLSSPWPFVMQDNVGLAAKTSLTVPTFLVSKEHGRVIQQQACRLGSCGGSISCTLFMERKSNMEHDDGMLDEGDSSLSIASCAVCTEVYAPGHTIVTLPGCEHVFHEACAMTWLQRHNTCPYCRHSLPLQDEDQEQARRQASNGDSHAASSSSQPDFYG